MLCQRRIKRDITQTIRCLAAFFFFSEICLTKEVGITVLIIQGSCFIFSSPPKRTGLFLSYHESELLCCWPEFLTWACSGIKITNLHNFSVPIQFETCTRYFGPFLYKMKLLKRCHSLQYTQHYLIWADALLLFKKLGIKLYSTNEDMLPERDSSSVTPNCFFISLRWKSLLLLLFHHPKLGLN